MTVLKKYCDKFGIDIYNDQLEKFNSYYEFLINYNKITNLTSITEKKEVCIKHFLDSLLVAKSVELKGKTIDIGTGAGFPGVPLKILNESIDLSLLDSSVKKINFLKKLSKILNLKYECVNLRAEDLSVEYREKFDLCVSRAVASLDILSEICIPFVKVGGLFVSMKGPSFKEEIELSKQKIVELGAKIIKIDKFDLPENYGVRYLVCIKKIKNTSKKYPRPYAKIKKDSLFAKAKFLKSETQN